MLKCQKDLFSIDKSVTYLNCAYMSPLLKSVEEAGIIGMQGKRTPSKTTAQDFFTGVKKLKSAFSELINCPDPNRIAILSSVSYGISTVCKNIKLTAGDKVIVMGEQFPSNYYPWKRLCDESGAELVTISAPDSQNRGEDWNKKILDAIDDKVAVVAMAHVHWADGTLFDLIAIRAKTKSIGALLIIDGTQSVGALPFDVSIIQPDALICAGYKWLLGPYSSGVGYFGPAFDNGIPLEENWINRFESEDFAGLVNYNDNYQPGAGRYSVGEQSNFILVPMLTESIQQLLNWGVENIQNYCQELFRDGIKELKAAGFVIEQDSYRGHHLFGIRCTDAQKLERIKISLANAGISVSMRGSAIRVSPHVYNDKNEVNKFVKTLISA